MEVLHNISSVPSPIANTVIFQSTKLVVEPNAEPKPWDVPPASAAIPEISKDHAQSLAAELV